MKPEEPCDGRLSSTVPWERKGETPLRGPVGSNYFGTCIKENFFYLNLLNGNRRQKCRRSEKTLYNVQRGKDVSIWFGLEC